MILATLVPFFICVLFGTPQAVAQVPMFTHQIVGSTILNPAFPLAFPSLTSVHTRSSIELRDHIAILTSETFTSNIYASGNLVALLIYTEIEITAGEYTGKGHA